MMNRPKKIYLKDVEYVRNGGWHDYQTEKPTEEVTALCACNGKYNVCTSFQIVDGSWRFYTGFDSDEFFWMPLPPIPTGLLTKRKDQHNEE